MKRVLLLLTFLFIILEGIQSFTFKSSASNSNSTSTSRRNVRQPQVPRRIIFPSSEQEHRITTTTPSPYITPPTVNITSPLISSLNKSENVSGESDTILFHNLNTTANEVQVSRSNLVNTTVFGENTTNAKTPEVCQLQQQPEAVPNVTSPSRNSLSDEFIRSKLCSNVNDAILLSKYRFDLDAKVCSPTGLQSHCGKYMIFHSYIGSRLYGFCECDYLNQTGTVGNAPLIYHHESRRCHYMYTKGFCRMEEWLEIGKPENVPVCRSNRCYNSGRNRFGALPLAARDAPPEYVPLNGNGTCVRLNEPNNLCKSKSHVVAFRWPKEFYPSCGETVSRTPMQPEVLPSARFLGDVATPECNPGSYLTSTGLCQNTWEFD